MCLRGGVDEHSPGVRRIARQARERLFAVAVGVGTAMTRLPDVVSAARRVIIRAGSRRSAINSLTCFARVCSMTATSSRPAPVTSASRTRLSRAGAARHQVQFIEPRTLEIFEAPGVADRMAAGGLYPPQRKYRADGGYDEQPSTEGMAPNLPPMLPQHPTEGVLRDRLAELGHAPRFGHELDRLRTGVTARRAGRRHRRPHRPRRHRGARGALALGVRDELPAGGPLPGRQGLNTSVQDAWNLGWKLAAVVGGAADALLVTYETERREVAAGMLGLSSKLLEAARARRPAARTRDAATRPGVSDLAAVARCTRR